MNYDLNPHIINQKSADLSRKYTPIWQVSTLYPPNQVGGAEKSVQEISEELLEDKCVVTIFCLSKTSYIFQNGNLKVYYVNRPLKYFPFFLPAKPILARRLFWHLRDVFSIKLFVLMYKEYKFQKPKVIISHNMTGLGYTTWIFARLFKIKLIHMIHDYNLICIRSTQFHNKKICSEQCLTCIPRQFLSRRFVSKDFELIGVSKTVLDKHEKRKLFEKNSKNIAPGNTKLKPNAKRNPKFDFGYIGTLTYSKGFDLFLDVVRKTNFRYLVAGRGDFTLIEKMKGLDNVEYIGWSDPKDFYSEIKYVIVPSRWNDPAPKVVYEAAASGVCLILAEIPSLIELANYYKIAANYFKSGDQKDLLNVVNSVNLEKIVWAPPAKRPFQSQILKKYYE